MSRPVITLTTDFGAGIFVGVMKGVILGICPQARMVDLVHDLPPQAVRAGALALSQAAPYFPSGTVHLAVVDPGVGTGRKAVCVLSQGQAFVGPDNGLFSLILREDPQALVYEINNSGLFLKPVSRTFHGRDVFAPAAAHLAAGLDPAKLGPPLPAPVPLEWPRPHTANGYLEGQVLLADRFGNLASNITGRDLETYLNGGAGRVLFAGLQVEPISLAYGQAAPGQPLALLNSWDHLELALNQGNLCAHLGLDPHAVYGMPLTVGRQDAGPVDTPA